MKQIVLFTTVVLAILLAFAVTWQLFSIVLLFLLSLAMAATARAPIEFLVRHGFGRTLAMATVYILGIGGLAGLIVLIAISLTNELNLIATDFSDVYSRLQQGWLNGHRLGPIVAARLPSPDLVAQWITDGYLEELMSMGMGILQGLGDLAGQLLLAIVLSVYWTTDRLRFERLWLSLIPSQSRMHARQVWRALEDGVGAYTRSELIQSILAGALLTLGYWLIGIRYPFLWALLTALAWLIPLIGGFIALLALTVITWMTVAPGTAIIAILYTVAVFILMEWVVERQLYQYGRYQKVLVLLVMIALVDVYGIMGLLLAPFLATAIQLCLGEIAATVSAQRAPVAPSVSMQTDLADLYSRLGAARQLLQEDGESTPSLRLQNLTDRLSSLLQEAEQLVPVREPQTD